MSVTFLTALTISLSVWPDLSTSLLPSSTLCDAVLNQRLDLLGGRRAAAGEVAHLGRDHREAAALLAGARRFDGGVQRQQVGLEGDLVDDADDVGDLLRGR